MARAGLDPYRRPQSRRSPDREGTGGERGERVSEATDTAAASVGIIGREKVLSAGSGPDFLTAG
jgi:hypothetical protein